MARRPVVYLSSPNTQQQAHAANGMPVLLSFPIASPRPWLDRYRVLGNAVVQQQAEAAFRLLAARTAHG